MKRGFIELMFAPMGIVMLSGIVLVSLNSAQTRAQEASARANLHSIRPVLYMCFDAKGTVSIPAAGKKICNIPNGYPWPILMNGWEYTTAAGSIYKGDYTYGATNGTKIITCKFATGICE